MNNSPGLEQQDALGRYDFIEQRLDTVADKMCLLEQLPDVTSALVEAHGILGDVETVGRSVENFRISSLARASQLMMIKMIKNEYKMIKASSYAYLVYSLHTLMRLTQVSKHSLKTGFEADHERYAEAIGAIIDYTDELGFPHMVL